MTPHEQKLIPAAAAFRKALLAWFARHQRPLPWRTEVSAYRTVVSELMCQQTQIATALPYFERWVARWPDFQSLARAQEADVLAAWAGLGYYTRARNLLALAQQVAGRPEPRTAAEWQAFKGVGPYTAAAIAAFALSEPDAGSDVAAMSMRATRTEAGWQLDGAKTWISNGGIADFYCVFARTGAEASGSKGISAFFVRADTPGLRIAERITVMSPHPLALLSFDACVVPHGALLGVEGEGFSLAMRTLDIFRVSVAAAATGFARRAMYEALSQAESRAMFGATLGAQPLAQAILGDMATDLDAAALMTYRAAWHRDTQSTRSTGVAAMAKLAGTELAQQVIDRALQLHGGRGVRVGEVVERLYRDVRALRIYEGATEVQRLLVGRETLKAHRPR